MNGRVVGRIDAGLLVLLGVAAGDEQGDLRYILEKIRTLRIFGDEAGKMNRALSDVDGSVLLISQFTLLGEAIKGRRPGFDLAAPPAEARALYEEATTRLRAAGLRVETGRFGEHMQVELVNDGPVTFLLDSRQA